MTVSTSIRFRERMEPAPPFNKVNAGNLYTKRVTDGSIVSTTPKIVDCVAGPQKIERVWDTKNPGPPFYSGGPFLKIDVLLPQYELQGVGTYRTSADYFDPNYYIEYQGGLTNPDFSADQLPMSKYFGIGYSNPPDPILVPVMSGYCSQVYAKLRPQLEKAGIGVALAELRDLPRMLKTTSQGFSNIWKASGGLPGTWTGNAGLTEQQIIARAMMRPKKVADHFLNHQFGWVPFLKDLGDFANVIQNARAYMDQVARDNNTWVKRVRTIDHKEAVTHITSGAVSGCEPVLPNSLCRRVNGQGGLGYAHWSLDEEVFTRVWAAGQFKYYRPEFDRSLSGYNSDWNNMHRLLTLLGVRITPSIVYKATPWTWAVDWFSDVGKTVQQISDAGEDRIASKYMYLMHHQVRKLVFRQTTHFNSGDVTTTWVRFSDTKQRQVAQNPYNFCLSASQLTGKQLAILAALGISRR